jgi:predicted Zn-dependent peptidase
MPQGHSFSNGFRLVHEKPPTNLPLTAAYIFCDVGSVHEPVDIRGVSHMIEHMCFKGTKALPDSKNIFVKYDEIGAYFNAFTSKRYTCFTIKCHDDYLQHCIDIVADIMLRSTFPREEYDKEHHVVIEENNNNENNNSITIHNNLDRLLYCGTSYENPVDELANHFSGSLPYKKVIDFYHSAYRPERMVLSLVSHIDFNSAVKMLKKTLFLRHNPKPINIKIPDIGFLLQPSGDIMYHMKKKPGMTNILLYLGFRTCQMNSPDKYILETLSQIIGSALSGKLLYELREKRGLVYTAKIDTSYYEHMGNFTIQTQTFSSRAVRLPRSIECKA